MKLAELKALSIEALQQYTELFHSGATSDQIKSVIGADDFDAKMKFLCNAPCRKFEQRQKKAYARARAMTRAYLNSNCVNVVSDFE